MTEQVHNSELGESAAIAVSAKGFCKRYGKTVAVNSIDINIRKGEIYGLIGPDGAGKSSFMKAVAGVLSFEAGTLQVFDTMVDSEASAEKVKQRIGFMPQGLGLNMYPDLSVEENIDFFARLRLVPEDELTRRKNRLLGMTRLEKFRDRPMKNLSGGMKQKLGLVCTLIHEPELIILDEPTTGVDPVSRRDFWSILAKLLREQGITALVSTAYMDEATRFQRAALMYQGKVLAEGEPDVIGNLAQGTMITIEVESQARALLALGKQFEQIEAVGTRIRIWVDEADAPKAEKRLRDFLSDFTIRHLECESPGLEDVFVAKLRQEGDVVAALPVFEPTTDNSDGVAIEAHELSKRFNDFTAVDKISFTVPKGEIFGLLGANGAGKTTAIKMLTGIQLPSSGEGTVAGASMATAAQLIKQRIGYMSQAFSLYLDLSVSENINLFAGVYGLDPKTRRERGAWIIELAGLQGHEKELAGSLPMGLRQRLALGCALVHKPQILFLDEPTSGVDPLGRRRFWEILFNLSRVQNVTILVTTHYMSEAEHCDHLALMYAGRVVADDTPDNMKSAVTAEAGGLLEVSVDNPIVALGVLEEAEYKGAALFGRKIHLWSADSQQSRARIESLLGNAGIQVLGMQARALSMEDVFVYRVLQEEKATEQNAA
ncbi:ATP-binding cassette domain-containing protein [Granulosicoccus antarcticus]|uniref:Putative ABC transporter ATP-binding protein YbhF n=1 Tax=Granulosicoccus antarcticus IMCC3135 TaxID=1192854 RepID=A0A2Z2NYP1_9GAMM|nr:ATP-binding cassette domain-containing protein [Granulosicoccus antarcticus]ASJ76566.1 putative ABC transporter ATP-binding protein YbhF [Granulosicoccus antarcticus IMCC3135]